MSSLEDRLNLKFRHSVVQFGGKPNLLEGGKLQPGLDLLGRPSATRTISCGRRTDKFQSRESLIPTCTSNRPDWKSSCTMRHPPIIQKSWYSMDSCLATAAMSEWQPASVTKRVPEESKMSLPVLSPKSRTAKFGPYCTEL